MKTTALTALALACFAANSLLSRFALGSGRLDPASFTAVRLVAGAIVLAWLARGRKRDGRWRSLGSAMALLVYAACFSFAYVELGAATGALLLFASVQATMLVLSGERPTPAQWAGIGLAMGGVAHLMWPGLEAPSIRGASVMLAAGAAWGAYSLRGRSAGDPIAATAGHFVWASSVAVFLNLFVVADARMTASGLTSAVASGAITSGVGYVLWLAALRGLTATQAATVQLAVPGLAAAGGIVLLSEAVSPQLLVSSLAVLGGIGLGVHRSQPDHSRRYLRRRSRITPGRMRSRLASSSNSRMARLT